MDEHRDSQADHHHAKPDPGPFHEGVFAQPFGIPFQAIERIGAAVFIGLGRLSRKQLEGFVEVTGEFAPVDPDLEEVRLVMLLERRFILQQVEPLAVHPVRQSGPLARERPNLPLEPREGPLTLDSELLRERLKLPEQVVQPHRGQKPGPLRLFEHRPLEAVVRFNCLAVSQRGPD